GERRAARQCVLERHGREPRPPHEESIDGLTPRRAEHDHPRAAASGESLASLEVLRVQACDGTRSATTWVTGSPVYVRRRRTTLLASHRLTPAGRVEMMISSNASPRRMRSPTAKTGLASPTSPVA